MNLRKKNESEVKHLEMIEGEPEILFETAFTDIHDNGGVGVFDPDDAENIVDDIKSQLQKTNPELGISRKNA